jgi:membrane-bound metal-dependent hydrolase YbcI (DUF457 family)
MIALGAAAAISTTSGIPFKQVPWLFILFASLLPDIDEPSSNASRPGSLFLPFAPPVLRSLIDAIAAALLFPFRLCTNHRGITHAPLVCIALCVIIAYYSWQHALWFALAYGSHLLADLITFMGIPLAWPFQKKNYSLRLCSTGSILEWCIFGICSLLFIGSCYHALMTEALTPTTDLENQDMTESLP